MNAENEVKAATSLTVALDGATFKNGVCLNAIYLYYRKSGDLVCKLLSLTPVMDINDHADMVSRLPAMAAGDGRMVGADSQYATLVKAFAAINMVETDWLPKIVVLSTDMCNTVSGDNLGLYGILRSKNPKILHLGDPCHLVETQMRKNVLGDVLLKSVLRTVDDVATYYRSSSCRCAQRMCLACGGKGKGMTDVLRQMEGKIRDDEEDFDGVDAVPQNDPRHDSHDLVDSVDLVECDRELIADMRPLDVELPTTKHLKIAGAHEAARPVRIKHKQHGGATRFAQHKLNSCDVHHHNQPYSIQHLEWVSENGRKPEMKTRAAALLGRLRAPAFGDCLHFMMDIFSVVTHSELRFQILGVELALVTKELALLSTALAGMTDAPLKGGYETCLPQDPEILVVRTRVLARMIESVNNIAEGYGELGDLAAIMDPRRWNTSPYFWRA